MSKSEPPTGSTPHSAIEWIKSVVIGTGDYGSLFFGMDSRTGKLLMVKQAILPKATDVRQVAVINGLLNEQHLLQRLNHPHVVQCLGSQQTPKFFHLFFEYLPGDSVINLRKNYGEFEERLIKNFTSQILDGLAYLHVNNIIHGAMKANNILVSQEGVVKITDFTHALKSNDVYTSTERAAPDGSVFWMAPEMFNGNDQGYSGKVDMWGIGCVIIEMLTGQRPWPQEESTSVITKVTQDKLATPIPDDLTLSPEGKDLLAECFARDPEDRPTAETLKAHSWLAPHSDGG